MQKSELGSMQRQALERRRPAIPSPPICLVPHHRVSERAQMYPDLVGSPGLQAQLHIRELREPLEHAVASDGALARAGRADGHALAMTRIASDRRVDDPLGEPDPPMDNRQV